MAARQSLDDKLAAIRGLRGQELTPEQVAELRKRIGDRSNLVVAAAAAIAGENSLVEMARDLEVAFDRFLVNPVKDDKLCRAKLAIVQALDRMEHQRTDVFHKAARHIQPEPVWGGTEDSAPPLRAAALVALARAEGTSSLPVLVDAMADPAKDVRIASAVALGAVGSEAAGPGPPPEGPARRQGPRRGLRMPRRPAGGRRRRRTSRSSPVSSTRPTRRLRGGGHGAGQVATGRGPRPAEGLLERCHSAELRQQVLLAIAILRRPAATDYLVELVAPRRKRRRSRPCRRCGSTRRTRGCANGSRGSCGSGEARGSGPRSIASSGRPDEALGLSEAAGLNYPHRPRRRRQGRPDDDPRGQGRTGAVARPLAERDRADLAGRATPAKR